MKISMLIISALLGLVACAPEGNPIYTKPSPVYKAPDSNIFVADQPVAAASTVSAAVVQPAPIQGVQGTTLIAPIIDNHQIYNPEGYVDPYNAIGYEPGYGLQTGYEGYLVPYGGNYPLAAVDSFSPLSYIWSLLPHSATVVAVIAKGATLLISGAGIVLAGVAAVFGFCSFTPYCHISMNGFNSSSLKEEVRSYITPDRISAAARFVREAIDKYQKLQKKVPPKAQ